MDDGAIFLYQDTPRPDWQLVYGEPQKSLAARQTLEDNHWRARPDGSIAPARDKRWPHWLQRYVPLHYGVLNNFHLTTLELCHPQVPREFDGFQLMFLSDLHWDAHPKLPAAIMQALAQVQERQGTPDVLLLGGDYQFGHGPLVATNTDPLEATLLTHRQIAARYGTLAVLGNHDHSSMIAPLQQGGIRVLLNEAVKLERGQPHAYEEWCPRPALEVLGTDDLYRHFSAHAREALQRRMHFMPEQYFRIALVHSPCAAPGGAPFAAGQFHLQLSGHTHAGQVRLFGQPLMAPVRAYGARAAGWWQHEALVGYTGTGLAFSDVPLRISCPPEIVWLTLRHSPPDNPPWQTRQTTRLTPA